MTSDLVNGSKEEKVNNNDLDRKKHLLEKYPHLINLEENLKNKFAEGKSFVLFIGDNWEERQFAHIIASDNNWFSRKIMTSDYRFGCYSGKCNRCHWLRKPPDLFSQIPEGYCCDLCDGCCGHGCRGSIGITSGKVWIGEVEFSPNSLKLGRKARRRRNRWRYGKILFQSC